VGAQTLEELLRRTSRWRRIASVRRWRNSPRLCSRGDSAPRKPAVHPEEEANDPAFAKQLASLADVFVQDAFGAVHRAHASTAGVAALLPSAAGLLLAKEIYFLSKALENPERPFIAILAAPKCRTRLRHRQPARESKRLVIGGGDGLHVHEGSRGGGRQLPSGAGQN